MLWRHGPAPHGLETDVILLEWRSLSWAFFIFFLNIILQYQRVQARALKQAGHQHKRNRNNCLSACIVRTTVVTW